MFKRIITLLVVALCISSYAKEPTGHNGICNNTTTGIEALSSELRKLLSQEMTALQKGMISLIPELASGNWHEIEKIATKIKGSYILKQKLTKKQAQELHNKLAPAFIELDQSFHKDAGMLADMAKEKNAELVNFYFSKMNNACINCHSRFATHRFPGFKTKKTAMEHKHSVHSH